MATDLDADFNAYIRMIKFEKEFKVRSPEFLLRLIDIHGVEAIKYKLENINGSTNL